MTMMKNTDNTQCWQKCRKIRTITIDGLSENGADSLESNLAIFKLSIEILNVQISFNNSTEKHLYVDKVEVEGIRYQSVKPNIR